MVSFTSISFIHPAEAEAFSVHTLLFYFGIKGSIRNDEKYFLYACRINVAIYKSAFRKNYVKSLFTTILLFFLI